MLAPGVPLILEEFKVNNNQLATFVVSVFVLGYATGPLFIAPMSELYGRTIVYHVCNILFMIFTIACAISENMGMLVAFRFLAGFAGVAVLTCGSGSIVDLMPREKRGRPMACWSLGPLVGPVVGPVCAGFFVEEIGWRWVFWIISITVGPDRVVQTTTHRISANNRLYSTGLPPSRLSLSSAKPIHRPSSNEKPRDCEKKPEIPSTGQS